MKKEEIEKIHKMLPKREKGKLNIYFHVSENSGVGYYRQYLAAYTLNKIGLANTVVSDFKWAEGDHIEPNMEELVEFIKWADIVVVGRKDLPEFYAQWGMIKEFFNIPIIIDTDDNVRFVRPGNPGYMGYAPNSESIQWNQYAISKIFSALTVSTDNLKRFHEKENPRVYILPNNLDIKWWDSVPYPEKDEWIRIGFIGSAAHSEGINIVKKPMLEIMKKHQNVKFLITHVYRHLLEDWPEDIKKRIEYIPWINLKEWPEKYKALNLDIGLAPLADNNFNRAKSNLRWLEYSVQKVASVLSPVEPYLCVNDGVDGFLAKSKEEWFEAIDSLVVDSKLRYTIADNAYTRIKKEFDIEKNVHLWKEVYEKVHKDFHLFFGHKKVFKTGDKGIYWKKNN